MAFAARPAAGRARRGGGGDAVARALAAAGGRDLLARVRALAWSGTARMVLGTVPVDLMIEMRIEPFLRASTETWLTSEGRASRRTVMIERDGGFLVHENAQTALPPAQARFERQRLGAYGYLLLAPAVFSTAGAGKLRGMHTGFPPIDLTLAPDGRIAAADYVIPAAAPERGAVRQHLAFAGSIMAEGVRFPRSITITQNGRPQMRMTIDQFAVELRAA